ncbi:MAG: response regulator transcription factor [Gammaproteobacteria bacterium]|nr:response regulator transcription factor [Gammaproteobacteria bacterium]
MRSFGYLAMELAPIKNVFVVEDFLPVRARLIEMLNEIEGVRIVGEAATPTDAVNGILRTHPQYVLLDFQLEGGTATDILCSLRSRFPKTIFIVLTNHVQPQFRQVCMEAGADFFLDKSSEIDKVKDVLAGMQADT